MNKEKLLELSDTLRGIAEGTHVASFEQWHEDGWINCKLKYRHEPQPPQPDPYAALKAAHAAGKTIQCRINERDTWDDSSPSWCQPPHCYRIKPEPRKIPLGPDDVPPGSVIRKIAERASDWNSVAAVSAIGAKTSPTNFADWDQIMESYEINRSIPLTGKWDKDAWEPCYKLIEE